MFIMSKKSLALTGFFAVMLALPAMANATLFKQHLDKELDFFADNADFNWSRADGEPEVRHPLLEQLFNFKPEQPAWVQREHPEPLLLPKLIMGIALLFEHFDFNDPHHGWEWKHTDTIEVPVPATAWLFGSALLSLVNIKRRS
jgi:hypothetical protein